MNISKILLALFFIMLIGSASASISVYGADAISNIAPSSISISTTQTPIIELFISGVDASATEALSSVSISTTQTPIIELFISGVDASATEVLSSISISTLQSPVTGIFLSGKDAITSKQLFDPWSISTDVTPPTLTITSPTNGTIVTTNTTTVTGMAIDDIRVTGLTVNGNAITLDASGSFTTTVSLTNGVNTITVVATDAAGNPTTDMITVTYTPSDTTTPVLTTITVFPYSTSIEIDKIATFTASTLDQNGNTISSTVAWSSSNTTVGTIDSNGVLTTLFSGTTIITATSGSVSGTATITVLDLVPGDLLLGRGNILVPGYWSHVGMYIGNGQVIESHPGFFEDGTYKKGVVQSSFKNWPNRYESWATLRVITADSEIRNRAVSFALDQKSEKFSFKWVEKDITDGKWYCSELVYAAYLNASNENINIEDGEDIFGITPDEIYYDNDINVMYDHSDVINTTGLMKIITWCPVDLEVIGPEGLSISKQSNNIPDAIYGEDDINEDGSPEDWISIPDWKVGDYLIKVIPEPDAEPSDTYTIEVSTMDTTILMGENIQISNIPNEPYKVKLTETTIIQIISATIDFEPDTFNLQSKGKWVTTYIELPEEYDVSDVNISTLILNSQVQAKPHLFEVGDYDSDGITDLMVKFDRSTLQEILEVGQDVEITVSGLLTDETPFEGSNVIRVINE